MIYDNGGETEGPEYILRPYRSPHVHNTLLPVYFGPWPKRNNTYKVIEEYESRMCADEWKRGGRY